MQNNNDMATQYEAERVEPNDITKSFEAEMQAQIEAQETQQAPVAKQAAEGGDDGVSVGSVIKDIYNGIPEIIPQAAGGFLDATKELAQIMEDFVPLGTVGGDEVTEDSFLSIDKGDTVTGGMARSVSQFLTGFLPAAKVLKTAQGANKAVKIGKVMLAGAGADAFVFDPQEERLADLIKEHTELRNPVLDYLASDPDDSDAESRFKNALEGLLGGVVIDSLLKGVKVVKAGIQNKRGANAVEVKERKQLIKDQYDLANPTKENAKAVKKARATVNKKIKEKAEGNFAANINLDRLETDDGVKELMTESSERISGEIDKARRGVVTNEQTIKEAQQLNMSVKDVLDMTEGDTVNAAQGLAARQIHVASQEVANELAIIAKETGQESDRLAAVQAQVLSDNLMTKVAGVTSEMGRALQAQRIMAKTTPEQQEAIKDIIAGGGEVSQKVREALDEAKTPEQIAAIVNRATKADATDVAIEVWYSDMLSAPSTWMINTLGSGINTFWGASTRYVKPLVGRAYGGAEGVEATVSEANAALFASVQGIKEGWGLFKKAIVNSDAELPFGESLIEHRRASHKAITAETFNANGNVGAAVDYIGSFIRTPGRVLTATDNFFKGINYRMELNALAFRQASAEGLEGEAFAARFKQILDNPPEDLVADAAQFAKVQTFTNDLGKAGQNIQQAANAFAPLRVLMPFIRTPVNLVKTTVRGSPLARISSQYRADVAAGGARRDRAIAQMATGTTAMMVFSSMTASGDMTGGGPASKGLRKTLEASGWQPYSLRFGNTYVQYSKLDPIGALMGISADYTDIVGNATDEDAIDLAQTMAFATFKNLGDKSYLKGLNDFFKAYNQITTEPENENKLFELWIANLGSSAIPNIFAASIRAQGGEKKQIDTDNFLTALVDKIKSKTPSFSDELAPVLNIFGDEVYNSNGSPLAALSPVYVSTFQEDPIADELVSIGVPVDMPPRNIFGIDLNPYEYNEFVKLANDLGGEGPTYRQTLSGLFKDLNYTVATQTLKQEMVKRITYDYRETAKALYLDKNELFKTKYKKQLAEKALSLTGEEQ